jgi:drug/metabolite transporter (DMT)-like permease
MSIFNTWQFYLVCTIVLSVIYNQIYKLSVKNLKNNGAGTIILQTSAALVALILCPLFPYKLSTDWRIYLLLITACLFYAVNDRLQTSIRKNLEVSVFTILNRLTSVFLILIGLIIFKEEFAVTKILGAVLILLANFILQYKSDKFRLNKYVALTSMACFSLAIAQSIDVGISDNFNLPVYIMITFLIPTLLIKTGEKISLKVIKNEFSIGHKGLFLLTGLCWTLLIICTIRAYQLANFTLIAPLAATSVLFNVLISTVFLGENKNILKKIIAAIITIGGIYLTVIS